VLGQLQLRLEQLNKEFETGRARFQELERQQVLLRERLLRISGAIQVLEELLAETKPGEEREVPSPELQHVSS
jgi:prefoldin subunit 5